MTTPNDAPLTDAEIAAFRDAIPDLYHSIKASQPIRNIADQLVREWDRMRDALQRIGNTAAIHYAGGAFDPDHMKAIGTCALTAIHDESFSWDDYPVPHVFDELAAANERIAELLVGAEAGGRLIDQGVVRIGELEKQLAEREASIQRLSAILDSYTE